MLKIGQKEDRKVKNDRKKGIECIYGCKKLRREKTVSFLLHSESFSVLERTKQCTKHRYSKKIFYPSHKQHSKDLKCWGTWNSESEYQKSTVVYVVTYVFPNARMYSTTHFLAFAASRSLSHLWLGNSA